MEENYLAVLSRFNHQEGYLDLALKNLIDSGLASTGFDGNREQLMTTLYDNDDNPYLLFNTKFLEDVERELERRIIIVEGVFKVKSASAIGWALDSNVHGKIPRKYASGQFCPICTN